MNYMDINTIKIVMNYVDIDIINNSNELCGY